MENKSETEKKKQKAKKPKIFINRLLCFGRICKRSKMRFIIGTHTHEIVWGKQLRFAFLNWLFKKMKKY